MAQSLAQLYVHIIFSTKDRAPCIPESIESELYAYVGATIKRLKGIPFLINGVADHIHVFATLPRTTALSDFIREIKAGSSGWIKERCENKMPFAWQDGYGAFSVSSTKKDSVVKYIARQKEHHKAVGFKEEFLEFLNQYGVEYDERYLWD